jgi:hypothetical protein
MQSLDPTRTQLCLFSEAKHQELKVRKATSLCLVFVYPRARYLKFHRQTPLSLDRVHAVKSQISQIKKLFTGNPGIYFTLSSCKILQRLPACWSDL